MKPFVHIKGGGIAGQVLQKELHLKGIPSRLVDRSAFPRDKVCGGVLQADSWEYLNSIFTLKTPVRKIKNITHFWGNKKISTSRAHKEMIFVPRLVLDDTLHSQNLSVSPAPGQKIIEVIATGAENPAGEWLGFQTQYEAVDSLQMHYGRDIYLGITPSPDDSSHVAFIVKRDQIKNLDDLKSKINRELGLRLTRPLKGTGRIHYGFSSLDLAIGDAKLTTHPFLGFGMKHAISSAQLMAHMIANNTECQYTQTHRKIFKKLDWNSAALHALSGSPLRFLCGPLLLPSVFQAAQGWLHKESRLSDSI